MFASPIGTFSVLAEVSAQRTLRGSSLRESSRKPKVPEPRFLDHDLPRNTVRNQFSKQAVFLG